MAGTEIEETVAHLARTVEDLSAEVARQGAELAVAQRRLQLLMERAAEAEAQSGTAVFGDERPPHY